MSHLSEINKLIETNKHMSCQTPFKHLRRGNATVQQCEILVHKEDLVHCFANLVNNWLATNQQNSRCFEFEKQQILLWSVNKSYFKPQTLRTVFLTWFLLVSFLHYFVKVYKTVIVQANCVVHLYVLRTT